MLNGSKAYLDIKLIMKTVIMQNFYRVFVLR